MEKIHLTERTFKFSLNLIKLVNKFKRDRNLWVISDQLLRSGTSIGANVTEAQSSISKKEFICYYQIALKSCNETKYWLRLLIESELNISIEENAKKLLAENTEIGRILGASLLTLKRGKRSIKNSN